MGTSLSAAQTAALFDILSHHNTYSEIRDFRSSGSLNHYGPPFAAEKNKQSTSPALQSLLAKFGLNLPGLRDVPEDFWKAQVGQMIEALEVANLSESYDKGAVGSRRTLATAVSALLEYPVRGTTGGFPKIRGLNKKYDLSAAQDLSRAFHDFMDGAVYGNLLEELVEKTAVTDRITDHEPLTQALHEFVLVNMASFLHFIIILSPKGQYLLKLLGNVNKLVPYAIIRQTLKIGNVATMINAMVRVILAKLSVTSVTNWLGITQNEDRGLNLMQQIISTVLTWDLKDLKGKAVKIEADSGSPSKSQLECLRAYIEMPQQEQDKLRDESQKSSLSIVITILAAASQPTDLSEASHGLALEYLNIILSIRDRKEIIRVLCESSPDHLTIAVRSIVTAYEPVIRNIHNAVDLSDTVSDFQAFLQDMIKIGRIPPPEKDGEIISPTVGDFVQLLKKHQYSCHKFLHQCCKNGKELTTWYLEWAKSASQQFRQESSSEPKYEAAGNLTVPLNEMFSKLSPEKKEAILPILEARSKYLDEMHSTSQARLQAVLQSPTSNNPTVVKVLSPTSASRASSRAPSPCPPITIVQPRSSRTQDYGPGAYLARWQDLLDNTALTPQLLSGADASTEGKSEVDKRCLSTGPDVKAVIEEFGPEFRELLAVKSLYW